MFMAECASSWGRAAPIGSTPQIANDAHGRMRVVHLGPHGRGCQSTALRASRTMFIAACASGTWRFAGAATNRQRPANRGPRTPMAPSASRTMFMAACASGTWGLAGAAANRQRSAHRERRPWQRAHRAGAAPRQSAAPRKSQMTPVAECASGTWGHTGAAANRRSPVNRGPCSWLRVRRGPGGLRLPARLRPGHRAWCAPP